MELFTMGAGSFPEQDVRESAKALAGWTLPKPDSIATVIVDQKNNVTQKRPVYTAPAAGVFDPKRAFKGNVTYLGKTGQLDTQGVIDRILAHPPPPPHVAPTLLRHLLNR